MEIEQLTKSELEARMNRFIAKMNIEHSDWDTVVIVSRVNQYYFMGTMQDAMLFIKKDGTVLYFVKRSYERALDESPFAKSGILHPMDSYRDAAAYLDKQLGNTYFETEVMTLAVFERFQKHFQFTKKGTIDKTVFSVRAVKSHYELTLLEEAGRRHNDLLLNVVPSLLYEGISEAEFVGALYYEMMKRGHHGLTRFFMFQTEMGIGQVAFGENSLYPTSFDGPGGSRGMNAAVPLIGSYERTLKKGDLVFVDIGFGINGYHSDKTQVYMFGAQPEKSVSEAHNFCLKLENNLATRLKTGATPSEIYRSALAELTEAEKENLGGFGCRKVKFFGHSIGLQVDEAPVIADGFHEPLETNMLFALEPKKGLAGVGTVGVEDTFIVTPEGGRCITGHGREIIVL